MEVFDELPSTSHSTPRPSHGDGFQSEPDEREALGADQASSLEQPSCWGINTENSIDDISVRVQDLVGKINVRRSEDQKVMDGFQETLVQKVTEVCREMKDHFYSVYDKNSEEMEAKLLELSGVLESCRKLSDELVRASRALAGLRQVVALGHTPEQQ